ncbi:spinster family MFS transporter [Sphingopyxis sp. NFH-91]|uniref:spinster family MFS transporter n=1 Tax=Sphingopyxis sp. NFH-91 TaxID=2744457 RepID=UPI001F1EF2D6|nr:MFS transporter [Sphingopyxis sp. NFH-91]
MATSAAVLKDVPREGGLYRWYVLGVLMLIYAMNFIDRQIVTILAPYLKADLDLTDAQIGLLYGTAFAMFYALFGIPLAKLADGWSRVKTLSIGLAFWSSMTALSGLSSNFVQLGAARLGVGIGEASGSPAAVSLLADYFPKRIRASVFALYTTGMYLGLGLSLMIGGYVVATWPGSFGLAGWQAAFIIVGLPGILLGAIVYLTIREPVRGALDGLPQPCSPHPFRDVFVEAATMFPPWSVGSLKKLGASPALVRANLGALAFVTLMIALLTLGSEAILPPDRRPVVFSIGDFDVTSSLIQWLAIGIGAYAATSWIQAIRLRDPIAFALTVGAPAYRTMAAAGGILGIYTYAIGAFVFLYGSQFLAMGPEAGFTLGAISAIAGASGTAIGGTLGDIIKRRYPAGRMYLLFAALLGFTALTFVQFNTGDRQTFFVTYFFALLLLTAWPPIMLATAQDLVIPRLRGVAFAVQTLASSLVGLGLGPYMVGLISDATGDLRLAILSLFALMPVLLLLVWRCARVLPESERTVVERARAAGEAL